MAVDGFVGLAAGAVGLGVLHGVEPGHGWPVAATYALDRANTWAAGVLASTILGVGHLVSSIAMVVVFFWAKAYFGLTQIGWMNDVAGLLLILLGLREYRLYRSGGGHSHAHDHSHGHSNGHADDAHDHSHADDAHDHSHADDAHDHSHADDVHDHSHDGAGGVVGSLLALLPVDLVPDQPEPDEASERGILGIAAFAFALGFAHEEEFEIIALCLGSNYCLELMLVYALAVIAALVAFTVLLIAGYEHHEERVEAYTPYLPAFSAAVLVGMGLGFLLGLF
jgi:hypothetical protein